LKRSEYVAIGAIGLLAVATVWPLIQTAPPENDPALNKGDGFQSLAFASLAECKDAQIVTEAICDTEYAKASMASVEDAPKFEALKDCETEYGANQCRPATWNGASVYIPAMAGVLIARSLAGAAAASQPLYPPRVGPQSCPPGVSAIDRPECQSRSAGGGGSSRSSYYSTGSGRTISRTAGAVAISLGLPPRTAVSRSSVSRTGSSSSSPGTPSRSSSSTTTSHSTSTTVSRGGFGSTSRSYSSSGS
jgi:uncharacterized protein YgiB involved in biofilm formation